MPPLIDASAHPRPVGQSLLAGLIVCTLMATTCSTKTKVPRSATPICASRITNQTSSSKARLVTGTPKPRFECLFSAFLASFTQGLELSCSATARLKSIIFIVEYEIVRLRNIQQVDDIGLEHGDKGLVSRLAVVGEWRETGRLCMMVLPCLALNRMIIVAWHESPLQGTNTLRRGTCSRIVLTWIVRLLRSLESCQRCD